MIRIEKLEVWGFNHAIRGMRNPLNSWDKSDSTDSILGVEDEKLMKSLISAGSSHRKFLRQIFISVDITAPLYWWKEFDTYKVATVSNSCSTMHTIHKKEFGLEDFSTDNMTEESLELFDMVINVLNFNRELYLQQQDKKYWWQMIQLLPGSYNQKRTVTMDYETLHNIYHTRKNHKLDEWRNFCSFIEELPMGKLITEGE